MRVAIASGKGGTGKTTVATSLARVLSRQGRAVQLIDCDVEEPDSHLFLHPSIASTAPVEVLVPTVDADACDGCGVCAEVCAYGAITAIKGNVLTFWELCHSCGGCTRFCPRGAISEIGRRVGVVETGTSGSIDFAHGRLDIGEAKATPVVDGVRRTAKSSGIVIVDAPPGTTCPVVHSVLGSDLVLLVTEPTPFGRSDLEMALDMGDDLALPLAVVVNRAEPGRRAIHELCEERGVPIVAELPDDRRVAKAYSRGLAPVDEVAGYAERISRLWDALEKLVAGVPA